jgi:hypothetical protein
MYGLWVDQGQPKTLDKKAGWHALDQCVGQCGQVPGTARSPQPQKKQKKTKIASPKRTWSVGSFTSQFTNPRLTMRGCHCVRSRSRSLMAAALGIVSRVSRTTWQKCTARLGHRLARHGKMAKWLISIASHGRHVAKHGKMAKWQERTTRLGHRLATHGKMSNWHSATWSLDGEEWQNGKMANWRGRLGST